MDRQLGTKNQVANAATSLASGVLQRACACGQHSIANAKCSACEKEERSLHRARNSERETRNPDGVPQIVHEVLRSPGQPLDAATRNFFEPRLRHDFSRVRVHTDAEAAASAREVNALAYTIGADVVFDTGQYAPGTSEGVRLLAHELAHVVQQEPVHTSSLRPFEISGTDDAFEREAGVVAANILRSEAHHNLTLSGPSRQLLQRQPAPARTCAGWESDPQSFSKVIADFYYQTELGGTPPMANSIQCQGDNRMCFVTYDDGTSIAVSFARVPDFVIARQRAGSGPRREYVYDCDPSGRVNFRPR